MKKVYILILVMFSFNGFSQTATCLFSDDNYHYKVLLIIDNAPDIDFNKADFISYLETNSNISISDTQFLNENLIDVFRAYPNSQSESMQRLIYLTSSDGSLDTFFDVYNESIDFTVTYCDCIFSNGFYSYYSKLVMDDIPALDFDKDDYIQHIAENSNISTQDINFLSTTINEVFKTFPSSSSENLQRGLTITADSDLLTPFLIDHIQAIDFVEMVCGEGQLSVDLNVNLSNNIKIIPNPIVDDFIINIDGELSIDKMIVYNINGKIIVQKNINDSNHIAVSDLKLDSGIYFFKFISNKNSTTKKVIVK